MLGSDNWEIDVDPARELTRAFAPQAADVKVWRASGVIKEIILQRLENCAQAVQELKETAAQLNAKIMFSSMNGYQYYFDAGTPLSKDWSGDYREDGKPMFYPPYSIEDDRRGLQETIRKASRLTRIEYDIDTLYKEKMQEECLSSDEAFIKQCIWRMQYTRENWVKRAEQINGEFYITMEANTPDLPECEQIQLSEYYRMKESLSAPAPQTMAQQKLEP